MSRQSKEDCPFNTFSTKQADSSSQRVFKTEQSQNFYPDLEEGQYNDEQYQKYSQNYQGNTVEHQYSYQSNQYLYSQQEPVVQAGQWNHQPFHVPNQGWSMGHYNPSHYCNSSWAQQPHPLAGFHHHPNNFHYKPFPNFPNNSPQVADSPNVFPPSPHEKNRRHHHNRGKFHGYGRGMGRGRCNDFRKNSSSSQSKSKQKGYQKQKQRHQQYKNLKFEDKLSSSSSEDELNKISKQMQNLSMQKTSLSQNISECLAPFYDKYHVSKKVDLKICKYLVGKFSDVKQLDPLISVLYGLESDSPQLLQSQYYGFTAVIKQIIKKNYDIEQVKKGLCKKQDLKKKKQMHDSKFSQKFPNPIQMEFLQKEDLLELDIDKTLFLIDANNIMPKQKHFRSYFESQNEKKKAEGQIRLIWMVYEARIKAEIFFDNKYNSTIYDSIAKYLFTPQQQQNIGAIPVHYAEKQVNKNHTADQKLASRLNEIVENQSYKDHEIVLVSADKELGQVCSALFPVKKTSGLYIFKYCKALIKNRNFRNPEMKGIVKQIFKY